MKKLVVATLVLMSSNLSAEIFSGSQRLRITTVDSSTYSYPIYLSFPTGSLDVKGSTANITFSNGLISLYDEGTFQGNVSSFNFVGSGITCTVSQGTGTCTITGGGGGGGGGMQDPATSYLNMASYGIGNSSQIAILNPGVDGQIFSIGATTMVVLSTSGKVGIGTNNPVDILTVFTPTPGVREVAFFHSPTHAWLGLDSSGGNNKQGIRTLINGGVTSEYGYSLLDSGWGVDMPGEFGTGTPNYRLFIKGNGPVGIGTVNPITLLDVNGGFNVASTSTFLAGINMTSMTASSNGLFLSTLAVAGATVSIANQPYVFPSTSPELAGDRLTYTGTTNGLKILSWGRPNTGGGVSTETDPRFVAFMSTGEGIIQDFSLARSTISSRLNNLDASTAAILAQHYVIVSSNIAAASITGLHLRSNIVLTSHSIDIANLQGSTYVLQSQIWTILSSNVVSLVSSKISAGVFTFTTGTIIGPVNIGSMTVLGTITTTSPVIVGSFTVPMGSSFTIAGATLNISNIVYVFPSSGPELAGDRLVYTTSVNNLKNLIWGRPSALSVETDPSFLAFMTTGQAQIAAGAGFNLAQSTLNTNLSNIFGATTVLQSQIWTVLSSNVVSLASSKIQGGVFTHSTGTIVGSVVIGSITSYGSITTTSPVIVGSFTVPLFSSFTIQGATLNIANIVYLFPSSGPETIGDRLVYTATNNNIKTILWGRAVTDTQGAGGSGTADNLGTHVATEAIAMANFPLDNTSSITVNGTILIGSATVKGTYTSTSSMIVGATVTIGGYATFMTNFSSMQFVTGNSTVSLTLSTVSASFGNLTVDAGTITSHGSLITTNTVITSSLTFMSPGASGRYQNDVGIQLLASSQSFVTVSTLSVSFSSAAYLKIEFYNPGSASAADVQFQFNGDGLANYAFTRSTSSAGGATGNVIWVSSINGVSIQVSSVASTNPQRVILEAFGNSASAQKGGFGKEVTNAAAATVPIFGQNGWTWNNTAAAITNVRVTCVPYGRQFGANAYLRVHGEGQ